MVRRKDDRYHGSMGKVDPSRPPTTAESCQALIKQAIQQLSIGRFSEANELCGRVLALRKGEPNALHIKGLIALQSGRPDEAVIHLNQAVSGDRRNPDLYCSLAGALEGLGRQREGRKALERALHLAPSHPQARYNLGLIEMRRGEFVLARRHFERARKTAPQHLDALNNLGMVQVQLGELETAVEVFRSVLTQRPDHAQARRNLANNLTELDRYDDALAELEILLSESSSVASDHFHQAVTLGKAQRFPETIAAYQRAIEIQPNYVEAHGNRSRVLWRSGEFDVALHHITRALEVESDDHDLQVSAARTYAEAGQGEKAIEIYRRVLAKIPDHRAAILGVVTELHNLGRFGDADAFMDNTDKVVTDRVVKALLNCQRLLRRSEIDEEQIEQMAALARDPDVESQNRGSMLIALGRLFESRNEHGRAFEQYGAAARLRREKIEYDSDVHDADIDAVVEVFDEILLSSLSDYGSASERPIFVVGMPRSGTTLAEQILASHHDVDALSELRNLSYALEDQLSFDKGGDPFPSCLANNDRQQAQRLQNIYLNHLRRASPDAKYIVDRMPTNYRYLGAIAVLFPNARVVHCRRRPEATALSIYIQNFTDEHACSWDLYGIGRRYRTYNRLMDHWRRLLPDIIFDLDYEILIANQEQVSRELLAHCRVEWKDEVREFSSTDRSIRTASNWQVRQRIYSQRVDGWRNSNPIWSRYTRDSRMRRDPDRRRLMRSAGLPMRERKPATWGFRPGRGAARSTRRAWRGTPGSCARKPWPRPASPAPSASGRSAASSWCPIASSTWWCGAA